MSPTLARLVFWGASACCLVAQVALVRSAIQSPMTGSPADAVFRPRRSMEIAWTAVPAIALALVLAFTWRAMHSPAMGHDMQHMPAEHRIEE